MANFCPNCGKQLDPQAKFCPSCGARLEAQPGPKPISSGGEITGRWEGKISADYAGIKGSFVLTSEELIFIREGKSKPYEKILVSNIKSIQRVPIFNLINICFKLPKEASFLTKAMASRKWVVKIKDYQSFIKKLKELNPKIK